MSTALEPIETTLEPVDIAAVSQTPAQMLALAIVNKTDPDTLSKLMDLHDRWEKNRARSAYVEAMAGFKRTAPSVIGKASTVDYTSARGRTNYRYANLGDIVQKITALLSQHDLHVSWETHNAESNSVSVTCHVTHSQGHRESVTLFAPPDESGNKNKIQAVGSTVTYLQRYTLLAALGLATADQDDDGVAAGIRPGVVEDTPKTPAPTDSARAKVSELRGKMQTADPKGKHRTASAVQKEDWKPKVLARIEEVRQMDDLDEALVKLSAAREYVKVNAPPQDKEELLAAINEAELYVGTGKMLDTPLARLAPLVEQATTDDELDRLLQAWDEETDGGNPLPSHIHEQGKALIRQRHTDLDKMGTP